MREVIALFLLCLNVVFHGQNNLHLFTANGELFTAFADEKQINDIPQASVVIKNIASDTVHLKIKIGAVEFLQTIFLLDKKKPVSGKEFSYRIEFTKEPGLVFSGISDIVKLPDPIVPAKPAIDTSYKYKNNVLENYCEMKNGKPIYFNNLPDGDCLVPMPPSYLNYMHVLMKKAQVDDDRFLIAENTTKNNCISVSQLNKILSYIPYELEKLKLLRTAYFNLTDKQNQGNLDSSFKMDASKRELHNFLNNSKEYQIHRPNTCKVPSDKVELEKFAESLAAYSTDNERYAVFKNKYKDYCYTTDHIKTIITKYVHDREKLDSAKLLYFYCVDKANYKSLANAFSYTTTSAELIDFVSKQK